MCLSKEQFNMTYFIHVYMSALYFSIYVSFKCFKNTQLMSTVRGSLTSLNYRANYAYNAYHAMQLLIHTHERELYHRAH